MAMLRYTEDVVAETELRFGIRLSNTERWAVDALGSQHVELICKYELRKLGIAAEAKANKLRVRLNRVDLDSKEYYETSENLKHLEREISKIEENLRR